jgi:hypothetical protein
MLINYIMSLRVYRTADSTARRLFVSKTETNQLRAPQLHLFPIVDSTFHIAVLITNQQHAREYLHGGNA